MTIEETQERALRAAAADDVAGIRKALEDRAQAMGELLQEAPSESVRRRLLAAIEAGREIGQALAAIKYRIGLHNARLGQLKTGLTAGAGPRRNPQVDYRG